jgi:ABC-type methionine transport system ATPase subunit
MAIIKRKVVLGIPQEMLLEPILYTINQQYDIKVNLYDSRINDEEGCMRVELEGEEKQIEEGLDWAMARGIRVETIS